MKFLGYRLSPSTLIIKILLQSGFNSLILPQWSMRIPDSTHHYLVSYIFQKFSWQYHAIIGISLLFQFVFFQLLVKLSIVSCLSASLLCEFSFFFFAHSSYLNCLIICGKYLLHFMACISLSSQSTCHFDVLKCNTLFLCCFQALFKKLW